MASSKAKLKSNGDRSSPCFKPFLIGNISDKFLPTRNLLYVSVRHIFISFTSFLGIPLFVFLKVQTPQFRTTGSCVTNTSAFLFFIFFLYIHSAVINP